MCHTGIKLIKKIVFKTFHDSSVWLEAQNHNLVFWKFLENTSLYDSDVSVFNRFPLGLENHQTSLNTLGMETMAPTQSHLAWARPHKALQP